MTTDPDIGVDTPPAGVVVDGPWRPLVPIVVDEDGLPVTAGSATDRGPVDLSKPAAHTDVDVVRPRDRALTRRVVGRWRSGGQDGRIYVLGRVKARQGQDGDDAEPGGASTVRTVLRTLWQIGNGHRVIYGRWWNAATHGTIRRQIRALEAVGDVEKLADWVDRHRAVKKERRDRLAGMPALIANVTVTTVTGAGIGTVVITAGGVLVALTHPAGLTWTGYWDFWDLLLRIVEDVVLYGGLTALCALPLGWFVAAWRAGKPVGALPGWLAPRVELGEREAEPITPSLVVTALRDLGISALTRAIKAMPDHGAGMLSLITIAGCGVEVDIALPSGTSTKDVQERQRKLAENLARHEHEVHLTIPKAARTIRAWIADPGALDEPIGPSPLVFDDETAADYYAGRAPWGQNLRGDAALIALKQRHVLVTGLSNQGKTAAIRALLLWLAFDPTVEFWLADLKGIGDWGMYAGLATVLIQGPADEHVIAATEMLEAGVAEMERRLVAVQAMDTASGVTRDMARSGQGLHPLVLLVDEAQIAFMSPAVGDDKRPYGGTKVTSRFFQAARKILNQGRAVNVTLWLGTQDPTNENLPKIIREACHIRASLVVGTEAQARMAVGSAAVDRGAAPHLLRQGLDKGTLVVAGDGLDLPAGAMSVTVRTHYIDGTEATEIAARAKDRRAPVETADGAQADEPRDFLADIAAVIGDVRRMATRDALHGLVTLSAAYRDWTFNQLTAALDEHGAKVPSSGTPSVKAEAIHAAIAQRDHETESADR